MAPLGPLREYLYPVVLFSLHLHLGSNFLSIYSRCESPVQLTFLSFFISLGICLQPSTTLLEKKWRLTFNLFVFGLRFGGSSALLVARPVSENSRYYVLKPTFKMLCERSFCCAAEDVEHRDVFLRTESGYFQAHRLLLVAASPFFTQVQRQIAPPYSSVAGSGSGSGAFLTPGSEIRIRDG
jgi:hypothetical protein